MIVPEASQVELRGWRVRTHAAHTAHRSPTSLTTRPSAAPLTSLTLSTPITLHLSQTHSPTPPRLLHALHSLLPLPPPPTVQPQLWCGHSPQAARRRDEGFTKRRQGCANHHILPSSTLHPVPHSATLATLGGASLRSTKHRWPCHAVRSQCAHPPPSDAATPPYRSASGRASCASFLARPAPRSANRLPPHPTLHATAPSRSCHPASCRTTHATLAAAATPITRLTAVATPTTVAVANNAPFKPDDCRPSRFPTFREHQCVTPPRPSADITDDELQRLTFREWLDYYLGHPKYERQRAYMFTDEQYCRMLGYVTGKQQRVVDYKGALNLDKTITDWLYRQHNENTYQYAVMEYTGSGPADIDKGPVLVCFKEPALDKGGKSQRRKRASTTPTTANLTRRCVPFSQIELVLQHAHTGHLDETMHYGQGATWDRLNAEFDGVTRNIVRAYVSKCAICQQKQTRTYKAVLVPILSETQCERVVFDLIDFSTKPSHGYKYILHAVDHFSKFHWAWAITDKHARTVAYCLDQLLSVIGAIRYPQCDQGTEFIAETLDVLAAYKCGPVRNSSAYYPQTNGVVERGNSMLKRALDHWFI